MDSLNADHELASEVVRLLNKELQATRLKLHAAEQRLRSTEDGDSEAGSYQRRARDAEAQNEALTREIERLHVELNMRDDQSGHSIPEDIKDGLDIKYCIQGICPAVEEVQRLNYILEEKQRTDQENADTHAQLELTVSSLSEKYERTKIAKKEMHTAREAAEAQVRTLLSEKRELLKARDDAVTKHLGSETAKNELIKQRDETLATIKHQKLGWRRIMSELENIHGRDKTIDLPLCIPSSCGPEQYLGEELKALCSSDGVLAFSEQIVWVSDASHHAIVVYPAFEYNPAARRYQAWTKNMYREQWAGQTRELFFKKKPKMPWSYAGTYRCIALPDLTPNEYAKLETHIRKALVNQAMLSASLIPPVVQELLKDLYERGMMKVECIGLQCVGFNTTLNDALKARQLKASACAKVDPVPSSADMGSEHGCKKRGIRDEDGMRPSKKSKEGRVKRKD
ncbi:hypothetical protein B0H21DRAFT_752598 [Amylocystis lapponica]|nr:hypothetical protein B0H21DRAFT_752598 [Amylocystis lapponica]